MDSKPIQSHFNQWIPGELLEFIDRQYALSLHEDLASVPADQYEVPYDEFLDKIVARQLIYLHLMTDYNAFDDEVSSQAKFSTQLIDIQALMEWPGRPEVNV